ncbi:Y-family DNA polymerase [Salipiger sp.]|uniref:Y-family DNA polymerase n=1 Tax=Salipiger sp. TaxID=2078585 RepID=UPI003A984B8B
MKYRRILSVWFPRLGAERLLRQAPHLVEVPFAVVRESGQVQTLSSLSRAASRAGLYRDQPLRDAHAMCADLLTRPQQAHHEAAFLDALHRWAGRFSPRVAPEPPDALLLDLTGCAHLFGGEEALMARVAQDCTDMGLSVRMGAADTPGAAWALARHADTAPESHRNGDAIDQEARATRSRAGKRRHWERGGAAAPAVVTTPGRTGRIAAMGGTEAAISPLPIAALRVDAETVAQLSRVGLRRIGDLLDQPRAGLARRFGRPLLEQLDRAMGFVTEPLSPRNAPRRFATRLSFPDPIGLEEDMAAALDRMIPRLCIALKQQGYGARTLRLEAHRTDGIMQWVNVSLAAPSREADRIAPLMRMKLGDFEAGFGIDMLRLEAIRHEPLRETGPAGPAFSARRNGADMAMPDLIGRLGARIGLDAITRRHPGDSHIPEKGSVTLAAAWSEPAKDWPEPPRPRPVLLWRPEPVMAPDHPRLAETFRWRRREYRVTGRRGPERLSPEWWLDDPDWRSGQRDYWQVEVASGERLWLFYAHGWLMSSGWFCQGAFA